MDKKDKHRILKEKEVETYLTRECFKRNWDCWKLVSPNRRGVPDRMILADYGIMVLVEVKATKGRLSVLQGRTIRRLQDKGFILFVVASYDNVDAVIRYIEDSVNVVKERVLTKKHAMEEAQRQYRIDHPDEEEDAVQTEDVSSPGD